jgi:perosamine synthetase
MNLPFIPLSKPSIGQSEQQAVTKVLARDTLSRGPFLKKFEAGFKALYNCQYAVATNSGTAGLMLALKALNVGCGDEVITVSFTVPATVNAIIAVGAQPILIDIDSSNLGMCPTLLENAISANTKAVIAVHAFGQAAHIIEINKICDKFKLPLIEDACEAPGNCHNNKLLGTFGEIGVFGFYPNKQITCGEGGMVIFNNEKYLKTVSSMRNHGRTMNGDLYDQHSYGWNFRLPEISAALGTVQLGRLKEIKSKRQQVAKLYQQNLAGTAGITTPLFSSAEDNSAWFVYVLRLPHSRDRVFSELTDKNIQCGRYFAPVHLQPYWRKKHHNVALPVTENIALQTLAIPFYTDMSKDIIDYVSETIIDICQSIY